MALASFLSVLIRHCHCHCAGEPLTSGLQGCSWLSLLWPGSIVGVELLSTRRLNGGMRWLHQPKTRSKGLPLGSSGVPRKDVGLRAVPSCWGTLTFSLTPGSQTQLFLHVRKPEACVSEGSAEGPEGGGGAKPELGTIVTGEAIPGVQQFGHTSELEWGEGRSRMGTLTLGLPGGGMWPSTRPVPSFPLQQ